jgi:hypothetical protein
MRKSRYTEERIVMALGQAEVVSRKLCKKAELSEKAGRQGKKRGSSLLLFIAK